MNSNPSVPIISVVGWANSGKTTFLEKLVTELKKQGYRVGVIKHHPGSFEIDRPGKDTWRMARAGAVCTAISGPGKVGLVLQTEGDLSPVEIAALMPGVDLIITEGYKRERFPQIEIRGAGSTESRPAAKEEQLDAVVGEKPLCPESVPCFSPEDAPGVAEFIIKKYLNCIN